jgi:hypothetical protein
MENYFYIYDIPDVVNTEILVVKGDTSSVFWIIGSVDPLTAISDVLNRK